MSRHYLASAQTSNVYITRHASPLKKGKKILPILQVSGLVLSQCFLMPLGVLLVMKTLEDVLHIVIKA